MKRTHHTTCFQADKIGNRAFCCCWQWKGQLPMYLTGLTHPKWTLTCKIFIRMTSSEEGSVPTNLAWVTASAMFSIAAPAVSTVGSEIKYTCLNKHSCTWRNHTVCNQDSYAWMSNFLPQWILLCLDLWTNQCHFACACMNHLQYDTQSSVLLWCLSMK